MAVGAAMDFVSRGEAQITSEGQLDSILHAVGRLVEEQGERLETLRSSHEALTEAFRTLQDCHKMPLTAAALGSAEAAAEAAAQALAAPISRAVAQKMSSPHLGFARRINGLDDPHSNDMTPQREVSDDRFAYVQETPPDDKFSKQAREPAKANIAPTKGKQDALSSSALAVVAAAHRRGLSTADLEMLGDAEWASLGASPHDRDTILAAVGEWQQQKRPPHPDMECHDDPPRVTFARDHIFGGFAEGDKPGMHGHTRDTDFEEGLERGIGHGRRHNIGMKDHIQGGTAVGDGLGAHGHYKNQDYQIGHGKQRFAFKASSVVDSSVPCLPGHGKDDTDMDSRPVRGRHFIGAKDHIKGGTTSVDHAEPQDALGRRRHIAPADHIYAGAASDSVPGAHGHLKDAALQGGMSRCIGHGKHHIDVRDHIRGGTAVQDEPGSHGHNKDDDFEGGLARGMGRGKHHMSSIEDQIRAEAAAGLRYPGPAKSPMVGPEVESFLSRVAPPQERPAGLPTTSTSPTYGTNFRRAASATPPMRRNCW